MPVQPIPAGQEAAFPYICCKNAAAALDFYRDAFGATELMRLTMPDGLIGHAEFQIGKGKVMLGDEFPAWGVLSPATVGGSGSSILTYVEDVDAFVERAVAAGAKVLQPVMDQFYGDRSGKLEDPFGHTWMFATHIEDVSMEEMKRRCDKMFAEGADGCGG